MSSPAAIDGIELSLFSSRIKAICDEMGGLLGRVAFSPNIRDRLDYSCALFDAQGLLLGQATHIPVHLGSMAFAMADVVRQFDWNDGDAVVFNDPFSGGTHLPDVTFVSPVFVNQVLIGFCANRAHHADIGAQIPGSMPVSNSLEQEGIIIPPTRVVEAGERDDKWFEGFYNRLSDRRSSEGDFSAQMAANRLGSLRLKALVGELGRERWSESIDALQQHGAQLARRNLSALPHGRYQFSDLLDDDGFGHTDIPIVVQLDIDEAGVSLDFTGTASQVEGNLNCPMSVTMAASTYVFRCLMPDHVPNCHGALAAVQVSAPSRCLVNARSPAAVAAGNVETSMRIVDVVCGALAQAVPDLVPAASQGTMNNLAMGARGAQNWDYYETIAGGMGAGLQGKGQNARHSHMTNTLNTPVEVLEYHYPLRVRAYALRHGSGGSGRHRGGEGVIREYEFIESADVSILSERRQHGPWGLQGGGPGTPGCNVLDGVSLGSKCQLQVRSGQILRIETPGGGGFGAPRA